MKLAFRQIEGFVQKPDKIARVILVYGPDQGLRRERSKIMARTVVEDLNDPFNVAVLSSDIINEDPARLSDEVGAISMMGGERLIRIENANDKLTTHLKEYLENPNDQTLIILEAGELGPRSSLRKLCESAKNAAAIPCYIEDERDIAKLIRSMIGEADQNIDNDATIWLSSNISGDRSRARSEIEKLILYKGQQPGNITIAEAKEICGSSGAQSIDLLIYAATGNNPESAFKALRSLIQEGTPQITILRALQNHFRRLHITRAKMDKGIDAKSAMKGLSPPVFFKQEAEFQSHARRWSLSAISNILGKLAELEAQTKQTGMPVDTLCAQSILAISMKR